MTSFPLKCTFFGICPLFTAKVSLGGRVKVRNRVRVSVRVSASTSVNKNNYLPSFNPKFENVPLELRP